MLLDGAPLELTETEFSILQCLAQNRGRVVPVRTIYETVWHETYMPASNNTVMVHIVNLRKKLEGVLDVPFDRICAHEFVASAPEGLRALDIAKALLDRGFHAPTVYFPLIVHECLMAEPTETESKQTLDAYIEALREIVALGKSDPQQLLDAPVKMPVRRLDETAAARHMILTEDME